MKTVTILVARSSKSQYVDMFNQDENYNLKQQHDLTFVFIEKKVQALFAEKIVFTDDIQMLRKKSMNKQAVSSNSLNRDIKRESQDALY